MNNINMNSISFYFYVSSKVIIVFYFIFTNIFYPFSFYLFHSMGHFYYLICFFCEKIDMNKSPLHLRKIYHLLIRKRKKVYHIIWSHFMKHICYLCLPKMSESCCFYRKLIISNNIKWF